jgi:hypothetical protein
MRGESHYNWKGGMYNGRPMGEGGLYSRAKLRKAVVKKRGHKCEWCRKTHRVELHHVVPYRFSADNNDDNLLLLCPSCHGKADKLFLTMAGEFFASAGSPGLPDAVSTLRSKVRTATTQAAS